MKTTKSERTLVLSFLFLTSQFLLPTNSFLSEAYSQSKTPRLEGTRWEFTINLDGGSLIQVVEYTFRASGKVDMLVGTADAVGVPPRIVYHSPAAGVPEEERGRAVVVPGTPAGQIMDMRGESGTYEQNGNSIHLEFSDHKINATISGNRMEGEVIKGKRQKEMACNKTLWRQQYFIHISGPSRATSPSSPCRSKTSS